jgi:type IV secretory pathway VirB9-like protein
LAIRRLISDCTKYIEDKSSRKTKIKKCGKALTTEMTDDAKNELQNLKMKTWRQIANNREKWAPLTKEAKVLAGL